LSAIACISAWVLAGEEICEFQGLGRARLRQQLQKLLPLRRGQHEHPANQPFLVLPNPPSFRLPPFSRLKVRWFGLASKKRTQKLGVSHSKVPTCFRTGPQHLTFNLPHQTSNLKAKAAQSAPDAKSAMKAPQIKGIS
jgi:hypothetical protein